MANRSLVQQVCSNAFFETFATGEGDLGVQLENNSVGEFVVHILEEIEPGKNPVTFSHFKDALKVMKIDEHQTIIFFPGIKFVAW